MTAPVDVQRKWFLTTALSYLNTPYLWGGDDPSGIDCSGYVINCLRSIGYLGQKEDTTAQGLFDRFKSKEVPSPREGALCFYFDAVGHCYHVTICLDQWYEIGASGGGSKVTTPAEAWKANAFVRIGPLFDGGTKRFVNLF